MWKVRKELRQNLNFQSSCRDIFKLTYITLPEVIFAILNFILLLNITLDQSNNLLYDRIEIKLRKQIKVLYLFWEFLTDKRHN